jgi:transketolase
VLSSDPDFEVILIATGSEMMLTENAAGLLRAQGRKVRVVSMPSCELFAAQPQAYRESVLPSACRKRVTVEMGTTFGWDRYAGLDGLKLGIDHFGHSAPYEIIAEEYGFTPAKVAAKVAAYLKA